MNHVRKQDKTAFAVIMAVVVVLASIVVSSAADRGGSSSVLATSHAAKNSSGRKAPPSIKRTAENGLLGSDGGRCAGFSPEGTCAVRFQVGHKANAMRSEAWDWAIAS